MTLREKLDNIEAEQRVWLGVGVYMAAKQVLRDKEISEEPEQVTWGSDWESALEIDFIQAPPPVFANWSLAS